jgi:hypothetical protein
MAIGFPDCQNLKEEKRARKRSEEDVENKSQIKSYLRYFITIQNMVKLKNSITIHETNHI